MDERRFQQLGRKMKLLRSTMMSWPVALSSWSIILAWALFHLWPSSWWMEVRSILVLDSPAEASPLMLVDREIKRDFTATATVIVRRRNGDQWTEVCRAEKTTPYRTDAILPDPLDLDWWSWRECGFLPPGRYFINTIWRIDSGVLPDTQIITDSNEFKVVESVD